MRFAVFILLALAGCSSTSLRLIPGGPIEFSDVSGADKVLQFDSLTADAGGRTQIRGFRLETKGQAETSRRGIQAAERVAITGLITGFAYAIVEALFPSGVFEGEAVNAAAQGGAK